MGFVPLDPRSICSAALDICASAWTAVDRSMTTA
jgi:hypothetical protein